MKITFTGITKEEAIKRLEADAAENRAFARRIAAKGAAFARVAEEDERKAEKCDILAAMIEATDTASISIDEPYEGALFFALTRGVHSIDTATRLYTITPEDVSEIPFEIMLAMGECEAAKTE